MLGNNINFVFLKAVSCFYPKTSAVDVFRRTQTINNNCVNNCDMSVDR